jgi:aerobic carbon-monoxide dehydrogenase medium subunit
VKPPPFEYHRAGSTDEAVALLAEHGDEAKVLAGGQSLVPLLSLRLARPAHLVDINAASELASVTSDNGLRMGALVRHRTVERSDLVLDTNPLLAFAVRLIGHTAVRTRGTLGGSLAHADPAAELPTVLALLDGSIEACSARGTRTIPAKELFQGVLTTTIRSDELLTAVQVPVFPPSTGWSFQEFSRRSGDFAIVGVAATVSLDGRGDVAEARLAFAGVDSTPVRASAAESILTGATPSSELWSSAARDGAAPLEPPDDIHGSGPYRRHLAAVLAERALAEAHRRATEGTT